MRGRKRGSKKDTKEKENSGGIHEDDYGEEVNSTSIMIVIQSNKINNLIIKKSR